MYEAQYLFTSFRAFLYHGFEIPFSDISMTLLMIQILEIKDYLLYSHCNYLLKSNFFLFLRWCRVT